MTPELTRPIRIILVDDHAVVRAGVRALLVGHDDIDLVGEAEEATQALRLVQTAKPDVVVLDLVLRGIQGLEVLRQVRERMPRVEVVVLSMHHDVAYIVEALRDGARGYVLKSSPPEELARAIRTVAAGQRYLSSSIDPAAVDSATLRLHGRRAYDELTPRQRQVCQLVAQGFTNDDIAATLDIARRTVESHRFRMMHKLGLRNQAEVTAFCIREGIIPGNPDARGAAAA